MSRLVAFGCSMTYGDGLPDIYPEHQTASKLAWPQLLADGLGLECVNCGEQGSSNTKIWHNILNFKFKKDDLVFVLWSYTDRHVVYENKTRHRNIGPWMIEEDPRVELFYQHFYTEYDTAMRNKLLISHANFYLEHRGVAVHNLLLRNKSKHLFELSGMTVDYIPLSFCDNYRDHFPRGLDNLHPGTESHAEFARDLLLHLNIKPQIPKQKKLPLLQRFWK